MVNLKTAPHLFGRAKQDARHITELTTQLEFLALLQEQGVVEDEKIKKEYEERCKREIKNTLANIYLVLDLHEVKGRVDHIFNTDFNPDE